VTRSLDPLAEAAWGRVDDAERYERGRPGYPEAAVGIIVRSLGLNAGSRVADVAAGTGKLTRAVAPAVGHIVAIEPSAGMRAVLERAVPGVEVLDGTAEALPLPTGSIDAIVVGEAFHWFDAAAALREFARVLRPSGGLALAWNYTDWDDLAWWKEAQAVLDRHAVKDNDRTGGRKSYHTMGWKKPLDAPESPFEPLADEQVTWSVETPGARIAELIGSWSPVSGLDPAVRDPLLTELRALLTGRLLPVPRRTVVWHTSLKRAA
jgi:SAM-dependent methyltransferase